jgi:WD40 repeat protein
MFRGRIALVVALLAVFTGELCLQAQPKILWVHAGQGLGVGLRVSADGTRLISGCNNGSVRLWSLPEGKFLRSFSGLHDYGHRIAISSDGKKIAAANEGLVNLWDAQTGAVLNRWVDQPQIEAMTFSPDGMTLAIGGTDPDVKMWSVPDAALVQTFGGHNFVYSLSFTADGKTLISGGSANISGFREWDVATGALRKTVSLEHGVSDTTISPTGKIYVALGGTNIFRYSLPDWSPLPPVTSRSQNFPKFTVSSDGAYLARVTQSGAEIAITISDVVGGEQVQAINVTAEEGLYNTELAFANGGKTIFSGLRGIQEWDVATGSLVREITSFESGVVLNVFSPDGEVVALADAYRLKLFRASDGVLLGVLPENFYDAARFSSDGQFLITEVKGEVQVWRVSDQSPHDGPVPPGNPVAAGRIDSPDGNLYATVDASEGIRLWRREDETLIRSISAELAIRSCAFSPDGSMIAGALRDWSTGWSGEIRVWRVSDGAPLYTFTNETQRINYIAWSKKNVLAFGRQDAIAVALDMSGVRAGPQLGGSMVGEGSVLRLKVTGTTGKTLRIEKTTDFNNRTEWTNVVATGGEQVFDYPSSFGSAEFFRVVEE